MDHSSLQGFFYSWRPGPGLTSCKVGCDVERKACNKCANDCANSSSRSTCKRHLIAGDVRYDARVYQLMKDSKTRMYSIHTVSYTTTKPPNIPNDAT